MVDIPDQKKFKSFIPTKADMDHCPLCKDKWTLYEEAGKEGKVFFICVKPKCMIYIWVRDPMLGRYYNTESEPCPVCQEPNMRLFYRHDGYIKMKCSKCVCIVESVDPEKHEKLLKHEELMGLRKTFRDAKPPKET